MRIKRVLSLILNAKEMYGMAASEQEATELMAIVDSCKTEEELLSKLDQRQKSLCNKEG